MLKNPYKNKKEACMSWSVFVVFLIKCNMAERNVSTVKPNAKYSK